MEKARHAAARRDAGVIRRNRVALKGPITTPIGTGFRSVNVALRKELDLYACLRPVQVLPGSPLAVRRTWTW